MGMRGRTNHDRSADAELARDMMRKQRDAALEENAALKAELERVTAERDARAEISREVASEFLYGEWATTTEAGLVPKDLYRALHEHAAAIDGAELEELRDRLRVADVPVALLATLASWTREQRVHAFDWARGRVREMPEHVRAVKEATRVG